MNSSTARGFTAIELMVTLAIIAVLASIAAPSFRELVGKQRLKGAGDALYSDLQYARSEAVQRNAPITITFNPSGTPWCYIIHTSGTCTCGAASGSCTAPAVNLKNVSGSDTTGVTIASPTTLSFEPRQGMVSSGSAVDITLTGINSAQLRNQVNLLGRVSMCSPSGTITGYPSC